MPVKITNLDRTSIDFSLYHNIYCVNSGDCRCVEAKVPTAVTDKNGVTRYKKESRKNPDVLTLAKKGKAGSIVSGLHEAILSVPQVRFAEKQKRIRILVTPHEELPSYSKSSYSKKGNDANKSTRSRRRKK